MIYLRHKTWIIPAGYLIALFNQMTFSPLATECMVYLCTSCDISGGEKSGGTGLTLEQCKSKCLDDSTCLSIDYGKDSRAGACYFNIEQNVNAGFHESFDGWSKSTDCGTFL